MAFVAIGATMVGSITFSKKKGEVVRKGDEVMSQMCFIYYFLFGALSLNYLVFDIFSISTDDIQFGYFSFGGSTVICVFEKVSIQHHFMVKEWHDMLLLNGVFSFCV